MKDGEFRVAVARPALLSLRLAHIHCPSAHKVFTPLNVFVKGPTQVREKKKKKKG